MVLPLDEFAPGYLLQRERKQAAELDQPAFQNRKGTMGEAPLNHGAVNPVRVGRERPKRRSEPKRGGADMESLVAEMIGNGNQIRSQVIQRDAHRASF